MITNKGVEKSFDAESTKRLAREIAKSGADVMLVHGAGSFGHIGAKRYGLDRGLSEGSQILGMSVVQRDVRELNLLVLNALIAEGLPAVSVPPSAVVRFKAGALDRIDTEIFGELRRLRLIPITFGDVVLDSEIGFSICSGDDLMLELAKVFKPERAAFVADVDGVYPTVPDPANPPMEEIDRESVEMIESRSEISDVTGGILRKARIMVQMAEEGVETAMINGRVEGRLRSFLEGKPVPGTYARRSSDEQ